MMGAIAGLSILGAMPVLAQTAGGGYFSIARIITILVLLLPWLYLSPLVSKDALRLRASQPLWAGLALGAGSLGILLWLLLPSFVLGLALYVVLVAGTMLAYVVYRNGRVQPEQRILTTEHLRGLFKKKAVKLVAPITKIKLYDRDSKIVALSPAWSVEDIEAYNAIQLFLYDMLWRRASEADVSPGAERARVRFVIDGMIVDMPGIDLAKSEAMIQFLKPIGGMNAEDRRRPQKGKISVDLARGATEIVLATAGTTGGQRMQLRVRSEIIQTRLAELGMSEEVYKSVQTMCKSPGLIVVSGRPSNGVTSTLYSLLREHDAFTQQIVTFEKNPAVEMENITQNRYEGDDKLAPALISAFRRDPDVAMVDSCADSGAAKVIVEASEKKALLLGMSAGDAFVALAKWVKLCQDASTATRGLRGVLCQMLVRKLCPACRESYRPDPQILAKANISADKIKAFYRKPAKPVFDDKGNPIICQTCQGTGYFGRTAVVELLEVTDDIRYLISGGAALATIKAACRKNRMLYLQEQALAKVIAGITSIEEVIRVSQEAQANKK